MIPSPQLQITNSSFIKSEIERFESVHPAIYSIYELIDELKDQGSIQSQIRDHVMVIEGIFEHRERERTMVDLFFRFFCEQSRMDIKSKCLGYSYRSSRNIIQWKISISTSIFNWNLYARRIT